MDRKGSSCHVSGQRARLVGLRLGLKYDCKRSAHVAEETRRRRPHPDTYYRKVTYVTLPLLAEDMSWNSRTEKHLEPLEEVYVDKSWSSLLPSGFEVVSTKSHGASYWTQSARIDVQSASGETESYFLKLARVDAGLEMVRGEFESMQALHNVSPDFSPRPLGYGTYDSDPNTHFFLCEFIDMVSDLPDAPSFCMKLAEMHRSSVDLSPDGRFGFQVSTYNGCLPQDNTWNGSWEAFYIRGLRHMFDLEASVHGRSMEIEELLPAICEKVIPRLLRPLETDGSNLQPCLVHGDLWEGNAAIRRGTNRPVIFDASAFWAHNEYDLCVWRPSRFKIGRPYVDEYFKHFPKSAPEEDWDDRNLLYSLRADLHDSALYPSSTEFRDLIIVTMRQLVDKYPRGYEGSRNQKRS